MINPETNKMFEFAKELAEECSVLLNLHFRKKSTYTWKEDGTIVTTVDKMINDHVLERISSRYPEHSIISEEGNRIQKESDYCWFCDPLDGSLPYSSEVSTFAFSLALVFKKKIVFGIICIPTERKVFSAKHGCGAFLNGKRIVLHQKKPVTNPRVNGVLSNTSKYFKQWKYNKKLAKKGAKMANYRSIIYMGMMILEYNLDGIVYCLDHLYDVAALKIIIEEAGGIVTDLEGKRKLKYKKLRKGQINGLVVALDENLHAKMLKYVRKCRRKKKEESSC